MDLDSAPLPIDEWALSPDVVHLNHGSYGGCPRSVIEAATALRAQLEAAPMVFYKLAWQPLVDQARAALAASIHAPVDQLVFVPNATHGVAIALGSCTLAAGDEILITDHTYRAVRNQLERLASTGGARVVVVELPLPFDPDQCCSAIAAATTAKNRLVVLDHITSPTAIIMPLERILPPLRARGIQIVVDGAHAAGQLDLDVSALAALGVTYYAGNNHKWLCAPKSTGFLVAAGPVRPLVTSHGASAEYGSANRLHAELDWAGTYDPAPQLSVPAAIAALAMAGTPSVIYARNHALVLAMREHVLEALGGPPLAPERSVGSMAAVRLKLPPNITPGALTDQLLREGVEVAIVDWPGQPLLRLSAHLYNDLSQIEPLLAKLHELGVTRG
ncbi:aminotransferase class V-fold PLP-dependent enzyme [soil metagenome]